MRKTIESLIREVTPYWAEVLADYLIKNGVVLPVRCKECIHYRNGISCVCELHSEEPDQYNTGFEMQMLPSDYCTYGERKDND